MSAIGSWLARAIAALGGPQTAGVVLVAGLVMGGLGGAAITLNAQHGGSSAAGTVNVYPCPNQGPSLQTIANGQQLLVTGRLADDSWVRIHLPTPGRTEGWVEAGPLTVNGSIDSLPVATCAAEAGAPAPAVLPAESFTAIVNATPSPGPTLGSSPSPSPPPPPSAAPSPTPNAGPALASLAASSSTISYDQGAYCTTAVKSATISVLASDTAGVASVALLWREPGAASYVQTAMARTSGTAASGTWQATLNSSANGITQAGTLAYYAVATDSGGATSRIPSSGARTITVAVCANKGPTISAASSSSGSSLSWDPLGVASCQTATNITAAVSDVDGVKAVTLFFRRPGDSAWASKPMDNATVPGKWYANLDTLGDKITIPTPPTGSLAWYIKAVDSKNVASQTRTSSITIRRCDSPAVVFVNAVGTSYTFCPQPPSNTTSVDLRWTFSIADPDTISSATLTFKIVNGANPAHTYAQTVSVKVAGQRFSVGSAALDGNTFYGSNLVTWTITTTDQYGGTSSVSSKGTVMIQVC